MKVQRLTNSAFEKIITGNIRSKEKCIIKLYSNECHLCHALKKPFQDIADSFEELHFFAFNADDYPDLPNIISYNGVPTILFVNTSQPDSIEIMADPPRKYSHKETWYHPEDIIKFIERNI